MTALAQRACASCRPDSPAVGPTERERLLAELPDWACVSVDGTDQLQAEFSFSDYLGALDFVNGIAELAEAEDHHPRLVLEWGRVQVSWWTHTIRGLHLNDFIMAARTSARFNA